MTCKSNLFILKAIEKGYKTTKEGYVKNIKGNLIEDFPVKNGYKYLTIRLPYRKSATIKIHRLVAYQKYGIKLFEKGILVRHLNGNSLDNSWDNISIGTQSDNMMDRPSDSRIKSATTASRKMQDNSRTYEDRCKIYDDLNSGITYSEIMKKHNISSKGTLSFMKNKSVEYKEYIQVSQGG